MVRGWEAAVYPQLTYTEFAASLQNTRASGLIVHLLNGFKQEVNVSRSITLTVALMFAVGAGAAQAQGPFGLELRGGGALPTADLGDASLSAGFGFGIAGSYRLLPHLGAYVGWDWHRMATDRAFLGDDYDVEDTGYAFGMQFQHPLVRGIGGWARAGGLYNHIELEDDEGTIVADSGHELGWELGGGFSIPLGQRLALTPGARYRTFSATLEVDQVDVPVDLSYVALEVGLTWTFGARPMSAVRAR
jgi:hypothetical protein